MAQGCDLFASCLIAQICDLSGPVPTFVSLRKYRTAWLPRHDYSAMCGAVDINLVHGVMDDLFSVPLSLCMFPSRKYHLLYAWTAVLVDDVAVCAVHPGSSNRVQSCVIQQFALALRIYRYFREDASRGKIHAVEWKGPLATGEGDETPLCRPYRCIMCTAGTI